MEIGSAIYSSKSGKTYIVDELLASTVTSDIYVVMDEEHNKYAAKVIRTNKYPELRETIATEEKIYSLLSRYPHCNKYIVCLYDAVDSILILELMDGSIDRITTQPDDIKNLIRDTLEGLVILHGHEIVHDDIHLGNIFRCKTRDPYQKGDIFKFGDFGCSRIAHLVEIDYLTDVMQLGRLYASILTEKRLETYLSEGDDPIRILISHMVGYPFADNWLAQESLDYFMKNVISSH